MTYPRAPQYKASTKYAWEIIQRRLKKQTPIKDDEFRFEWEVLEGIEVRCFELLGAWEIPEDLWPYYTGYAKIVWERKLKFTADTLAAELQALRDEYVLRGLDLTVLIDLEPYMDYFVEWKKSGEEDRGTYLSKFKVALSAQQTIPNGVQTVVAFDQKVNGGLFDLLDEFNVTNHRFEPKNEGYYVCTARLVYTGLPLPSSWLLMIFRGWASGDASQVFQWREAVVANNDMQENTVLLYLPKGYYVEVQTQQTTGGNRNLQSGTLGCRFEGFRVG
jgi:hypothetical protein